MRRLVIAIALAAAGLGAAAAPAADVAQLSCPRSALSAAELSALSQFIADRGTPADPRFEPISRASERCAATFSWSARQMRAALIYNLAEIGAAQIRAQFADMDIDLAALEPVVTNDRPLMDAARAGGITPEQGTAFAVRHVDVIERVLGSRLHDQAIGERLGFFIGYWVMMEAARLEFAER